MNRLQKFLPHLQLPWRRRRRGLRRRGGEEEVAERLPLLQWLRLRMLLQWPRRLAAMCRLRHQGMRLGHYRRCFLLLLIL